MPTIIISVFADDETIKEKIKNQIAAIAKGVFCPLTGTLPLPKGSTEIAPDFREFNEPVGGNRITILLHKKPERTPEKIQEIREKFKAATNGDLRIEINPQEEKYWVKV